MGDLTNMIKSCDPHFSVHFPLFCETVATHSQLVSLEWMVQVVRLRRSDEMVFPA